MELILPNINVILLCGVPGVGKTYFTTILEEKFYNAKDKINESELIYIIKFNFDELFFKFLNVFDYPNSVEYENKFKLNLTNFKKIRKDYFNNFRDKIEEVIQYDKKSKYIFILDDNFYFKSMRKPFYKYCKELSLKTFNLSYLEIHLKSSLEYALKLNSLREGYHNIPENIIHKLNDNFQWNSFYKNLTFLINIENKDTLNNVDKYEIINKLIENRNFINDIAISENLDNLKINKTKNKESFVDFLESKLRKKVGEILKLKVSSIDHKFLSEKKKEFMQKIKNILFKNKTYNENDQFDYFKLKLLLEQANEINFSTEDIKIINDILEEFYIHIKII